jgi:hypothetical protein
MAKMRLLRAYMFKQKDPAIDIVRTLVQDHYKTTSSDVLEKIADDGGPTAGTMHQWFHGKTMRPQNATLEAAGRALGMQRVWVKLGRTRP